jgi:hypothetical protein
MAALAGGLVLGLAPAASAESPADYVISISVDGLGSKWLQPLIEGGQLPNFSRIKTGGAWTYNARTDYDYTVTLPDHVTEVTSRGVLGAAGHNWTDNDDPPLGATLASNKGSYVAGVFDVAHDNGLRTAMYATKSKFSLFDVSYNATNGAPDSTGADNGRDKIDTYLYDGSSSVITSSYVSAMQSNPYNYAFLHFADGDLAGHAHNWGSAEYNDAIKAVDGYLGTIFDLIDTSATLAGHTTIILTADHGGHFSDHENNADPYDYTIPLGVWGAGVQGGSDLYALNEATRTDPGDGRPTYSDPNQPIRNGDVGNLALDLLGLGPIPGSTIDNPQNLVVPEPATLALLALGAVLMLTRRRRVA